MIMNGLKLKYYWLVFYLFSFSLSLITLFTFYIMGIYFFNTIIFVETNAKLIVKNIKYIINI